MDKRRPKRGVLMPNAVRQRQKHGGVPFALFAKGMTQ
jgi:hypothetical protein